MRVALWVFTGKCNVGELGERNTEKLNQQNGNHHNSDTRVGERKIGVTIGQRTTRPN
jgi:hypothetical protein